MKILLIAVPLLAGCSLFGLPDEMRALKLTNKGFAATLVGLKAKVAEGEITPAEAQLAAMAASKDRDDEIEAAAVRTDAKIDAAISEARSGALTIETAMGGSGALTALGMAGLHMWRNRTRKKAMSNGSVKT